MEGKARCPTRIRFKRGRKVSWWKKNITVLSYKAEFLKRIALNARLLWGKRMHQAKGSGNTTQTRKLAAGSDRDT